MKNIAVLIVISLVCTSIVSAEESDPVTKLESKILKNLEDEQWNSFSKDFVFNMWNEYRQAHLYTRKSQVTRSISGKRPDISDYNEYLGTFTRDPNSTRIFIEITKNSQGHFFVNLEENKIPAALTNDCVIFTTGDIVYSKKPQFGEKPYCTLEMIMVIRTNGKFYIASQESSSDQWMEITKSNSTTGNNQFELEVEISTPEEEKNWKKEYEKLRLMNQNLEGMIEVQRKQLQEMAIRIDMDQKTINILQQQLKNK